jgi:hypothetical protein
VSERGDEDFVAKRSGMPSAQSDRQLREKERQNYDEGGD